MFSHIDGRRRRIGRLALWLGVLGIALAGAPAQALVVQYAVDELDAGAGRWQYRYFVSDGSFGSDAGFSIVFPLGLYQDLESPPPSVNSDWDVITLQPDPLLPDHGLYDALALVGGASLADPFQVAFTFLGEGTPGSQAFEVFQAGFAVIETGQTVLIPEPALAGPALLVWLLARRRLRRRQPG